MRFKRNGWFEATASDRGLEETQASFVRHKSRIVCRHLAARKPVLVGAELNAEIEHQTAHDTTVPPDRPIGLRGAVMADTVGKAWR